MQKQARKKSVNKARTECVVRTSHMVTGRLTVTVERCGEQEVAATLSQGAATLFLLEAVAMSQESAPEVKLVLCDNEGVGSITVDMEAFFEFSFWMAEELQDFVAERQHMVRPRETRNARRTRLVT